MKTFALLLKNGFPYIINVAARAVPLPWRIIVIIVFFNLINVFHCI